MDLSTAYTTLGIKHKSILSDKGQDSISDIKLSKSKKDCYKPRHNHTQADRKTVISADMYIHTLSWVQYKRQNTEYQIKNSTAKPQYQSERAALALLLIIPKQIAK